VPSGLTAITLRSWGTPCCGFRRGLVAVVVMTCVACVASCASAVGPACS
jgi:hypothetical protein